MQGYQLLAQTGLEALDWLVIAVYFTALVGVVTLTQIGDFGAALGPEAAHHIAVGAETLALRMERQCANAKKVAAWLRGHEKVERVYYTDPGLAHILAGFIMRRTDTRAKRIGWVTGLIVGPIALAWALFPQLDYLPPVKRDAVDSFLSLPPGSGLRSASTPNFWESGYSAISGEILVLTARKRRSPSVAVLRIWWAVSGPPGGHEMTSPAMIS